MALRDLSKIYDLDPHIQDMLHELDNQTDRGAALVAASMVDVTLTALIRCRIAEYKDVLEILFENEGAPLGSFAAKITVARAFGVIGENCEVALNTIRRIRNQFAHSPLKIDFSHELIAEEIENLMPDPSEWKPEFSPGRRRYIGTCVLLMQNFGKAKDDHISDTIDVWLG